MWPCCWTCVSLLLHNGGCAAWDSVLKPVVPIEDGKNGETARR